MSNPSSTTIPVSNVGVFTPKQKATWQPNSDTNFCNECDAPIRASFFRTGKHHCRACAQIICSPCNREYRIERHKVCHTCFVVYDAKALQHGFENKSSLSKYSRGRPSPSSAYTTPLDTDQKTMENKKHTNDNNISFIGHIKRFFIGLSSCSSSSSSSSSILRRRKKTDLIVGFESDETDAKDNDNNNNDETDVYVPVLPHCPICDMQEEEYLYLRGCGHLICKYCLKQYITVDLKNINKYPFRCFQQQCEAIIDFKDVRYAFNIADIRTRTQTQIADQDQDQEREARAQAMLGDDDGGSHETPGGNDSDDDDNEEDERKVEDEGDKEDEADEADEGAAQEEEEEVKDAETDDANHLLSDRELFATFERFSVFCGIPDSQREQCPKCEMLSFFERKWNGDRKNDNVTFKWIEDQDRDSCHGCHRQLKGFWNPSKHHCRMCGDIYCHTCSEYELPLSVTCDAMKRYFIAHKNDKYVPDADGDGEVQPQSGASAAEHDDYKEEKEEKADEYHEEKSTVTATGIHQYHAQRQRQQRDDMLLDTLLARARLLNARTESLNHRIHGRAYQPHYNNNNNTEYDAHSEGNTVAAVTHAVAVAVSVPMPVVVSSFSGAETAALNETYTRSCMNCWLECYRAICADCDYEYCMKCRQRWHPLFDCQRRTIIKNQVKKNKKKEKQKKSKRSSQYIGVGVNDDQKESESMTAENNNRNHNINNNGQKQSGHGRRSMKVRLKQTQMEMDLAAMTRVLSEKQNEKHMIEEDYRQCPGCQTYVSKTEGCNHMTHALCTNPTTEIETNATHFCYCCSATLYGHGHQFEEEDELVLHFPNGVFNECARAHGIRQQREEYVLTLEQQIEKQQHTVAKQQKKVDKAVAAANAAKAKHKNKSLFSLFRQ